MSERLIGGRSRWVDARSPKARMLALAETVVTSDKLTSDYLSGELQNLEIEVLGSGFVPGNTWKIVEESIKLYYSSTDTEDTE
jgi:hypothetical protein